MQRLQTIMAKVDLSKILQLGLLATRKWLISKDLSASLLDNHVKSGKLLVVAKGVYIRPELKLSEWQAVVISLCQMNFPVYVGGLTALESQGLGHYLSLGGQSTCHLYSRVKSPRWLQGVLESNPQIRIEWHLCTRMWNEISDHMAPLKDMEWRSEYRAYPVASAEQAILEVLHDVPDKISFEHADQLMQGMVTLSPKRLDFLLKMCSSIKAKRLFFWLADRYSHPWRFALDHAQYDLGSGKRVLQKGGRLIGKYGITVPKEMIEDERDE